MLDANNELLTYIHQNAEMGRDTVRQLMGIAKDPEFQTLLRSQYREYNSVSNISEKKLRTRDKPAKDVGPMTKTAAYLSINLNTLADKSPSHISEMLIKGSTMGVIDMTKRIKEYSTAADPDVIDLADSLLRFEQHNIQECQRFLI
jgi:hypothetical protein